MDSIKINSTVSLSKLDISDLLVAAFEGGINYWCDEVKIVEPEKYTEKDLFASDVEHTSLRFC
jgi:hypothetical protein